MLVSSLAPPAGINPPGLLGSEHLPSESRTLTTVVPISCGATGIKPAVLINVKGDVENVWVFVKRLLDSVSCDCVSSYVRLVKCG